MSPTGFPSLSRRSKNCSSSRAEPLGDEQRAVAVGLGQQQAPVRPPPDGPRYRCRGSCSRAGSPSREAGDRATREPNSVLISAKSSRSNSTTADLSWYRRDRRNSFCKRDVERPVGGQAGQLFLGRRLAGASSISRSISVGPDQLAIHVHEVVEHSHADARLPIQRRGELLPVFQDRLPVPPGLVLVEGEVGQDQQQGRAGPDAALLADRVQPVQQPLGVVGILGQDAEQLLPQAGPLRSVADHIGALPRAGRRRDT